jgi:glycosyltransferase involved in cell wall biosynthesis
MVSSPDVTVVIPTLNRPELVTRAVRSALEQTLREVEVVVVIDGPDEATHKALAAIGDSRLRVLELPERGGAPAARNAGVRAARGAFVAFLDDDDEWLPGKLLAQVDLARSSTVEWPIVITRLFVRTPRTEFILPRRLPDPGEPLSEWLSVRKGPFHGDGFIQTSTIMAPVALLRDVPFTEDLRRLQELDWSLRALDRDGVDLLIVDEPLVVWYADEHRPRISDDSPVRESLAWLRKVRPLVTRRAYAALAMSVVSSMAAQSRSPKVFGSLLYESVRHGRPGIRDVITFGQIWLVPARLRRIVRDKLIARRGGH